MNANHIAVRFMKPEPETILPPVNHAMNAACISRIPEPADAPLITDAELAYWDELADELESERHQVRVKKMRRYHY